MRTQATPQQLLSLILCMLLTFLPFGCGGGTQAASPEVPRAPLKPAVFEDLHENLQDSYLNLFEKAPGLEYSQSQIDEMRNYLEEAKGFCVSNFENKRKSYESQLETAQETLKEDSPQLTEEQRHERHCEIQNLRILKSQAKTLEENAIPLAYDNKEAKLKLIEQWPQDYQETQRKIETGEYHDREYGDPQDIGFRQVGEGQKEDIQKGEDAIQRMKQSGLMPPKVENEAVQSYVTELAENIAANSDLRVPVKIEVLNAKEINAFALPGGFLFLQRGLLEEAEDEAQLAGVIAHEIAHAAARHGHQLMQRQQIASIIYQVAQVAALVLTGGAASIGTYYALQYGFYGLGLVLSLDLLGVSREFELEADRLGIQYAWNSGYDPSGFIRFFDKMATTKGYVDGTSWFRTHPPFYKRMVQSKQEIMYLPEKEQLTTNTEEFKEMKDELQKVVAKAEEEQEGKPSLKLPEQGCPPPDEIEYEAGQPIESICEIPTPSS